MKLKSVLNKAKKLELNVILEKSRYSITSVNKIYTIEFNTSDDNVHCLNLRRLTDHSDSMTDYHAGSYYYTLNDCFNSMLRGEETIKAEREKAFNERLVRIELERLEGPTNLCVKHEFKTLAEYRKHISENFHTYTEMGYDKHKLNVVFADDCSYSYRLDAQHPLNQYFKPEDYSPMKHIKSTWDYARKNEATSQFTQEDMQYMAKVVNRLRNEEYKEKLAA